MGMYADKTAAKSQEYSDSIINTVREPLIVLDQDLRVVTVSRSFYEVFKVEPGDTVGQLIYDLGNKQWNIPKLRNCWRPSCLKKQPLIITWSNTIYDHWQTDNAAQCPANSKGAG